MKPPNTTSEESLDSIELSELEILWKRLNRQGRYHDKPIKYSEFVRQIRESIKEWGKK